MLKTITSVANTVGALEYKGLWDAATNTPTLVSSVGTQGDYYVVSVAGTTNLDGVTTWDEGDWAIFNGSVWQLFQGGQDGVFATLTVSGEIAANGGIALGDNDKATFGDGDDLQIYHVSADNSSYIRELGAGNLKILGDNVQIMNSAGTENQIFSASDGGVTLYHNGSAKLSSLATGIDVTGTATMDGLTVEGDINLTEPSPTITFTDTSDSSVHLVQSINTALNIQGQSQVRLSTTATERVRVNSNGDVSFYEDTGTTPKLFWSASDESLGIGNSSPSSSYSIDAAKGIRSSGAAPNFTLQETDASNQTWLMASYGGNFAIRDTTVAGTAYPFQIEAATPSNTLYLDSTGNVGINTSSPAFGAISNGIEVEGTTAGIRLQGATTGALELYHNNGLSTIDSRSATGGSKIAFKTESIERLRITSEGLVGINTSSPAASLDIRSPNTAVQSRGNLYVTTTSTAAINEGAQISLGGTYTGTSETFFGAIAARKENATVGDFNAYLQFSVRNTGGLSEKARLTSAGNLLVGTNTTTFSDDGIRLYEYGAIEAVRASYPVMHLNRRTSDGDIAKFYKDGITVGSIGTYVNLPYIGKADVNLLFDPTGPHIIPRGTNGGARDAAISLGASTNRFKDLYLSGGVVFGTTGGSVSSKTLDDYEVGTFTATVAGSSTAGSATYPTQGGTYEKIGDMVHFRLYIQWASGTGAGSLQVGGLPFITSSASTSYESVTIGYIRDVTFSGVLTAYTELNASYIVLRDNVSDGTGDNLIYDGSGRLMLSGSYRAA